jgi:hypothetical protein
MRIKVTNIVYDTDGESVDLPREMILDVDNVEDTDEIVDMISDRTDWCVTSYNYEIL